MAVVGLKVQVPALVTKLPPAPAIKVEPSGDIDEDCVGLVVGIQPAPVHWYQSALALST
jgi:hypothetical protein